MSAAFKSIVIGAYLISITFNSLSNGNPIASSQTGRYKVVCNLQEWGSIRYLPEHANGVSCTHVVFGRATLDESSLRMKPKQSWLNVGNPFYDLLRLYKQRGIKVILGFGGWSDSASDKYSRMVNNVTSRNVFVTHALGFLEANGFDGLELFWHWPIFWRTDGIRGPASDKEGFSLLMQELNTALKLKELSLSAVVTPNAYHMDLAFNFTTLVQHLDWILVKSYDYYGFWNGRTGHTAPLYDHPNTIYHSYDVNYTIHHLISRGVPPRQIVMGIPFYGRARTIKNPKAGVGLNVPAGGERNIVLYHEICKRINSGNWTVVKDPLLRMGPYAYKGNEWLSFDDAEMIRHKARYIQEKDLGGATVRNLEYDDFLGTCGQGKHPLLCALLQVLVDPVEFAKNVDCREGSKLIPIS